MIPIMQYLLYQIFYFYFKKVAKIGGVRGGVFQYDTSNSVFDVSNCFLSDHNFQFLLE
jgi:lipopolysaccharide assembly outer membrane protein LptD (OstA)